jgi:PAS domain S-box-containing protein
VNEGESHLSFIKAKEERKFKMNVDMFTQQVQTLQERLTLLYQSADTQQKLPTDSFVPSLLKELGTSSEELQVAGEELLHQTETLISLRQQLEAERQSYKDLFEFMPQAYLVTDAQGKILQANRAAATLLGVEQSRLQDKLLVSFIPVEKRSAFRSNLNQLQKSNWVQQNKLRLQAHQGESFKASVTVAPVRNSSGELVSLRWVLYDITRVELTQLPFSLDEYDSTKERPTQVYFKGDLIPLKPEQLLLVRQGLVKLSTINERAEEMLVGLVGSSMPFGSSLTELPTYQAIALSQKVELVCISLSEITASPKLAIALLPQISQRLRQTESLLAIAGRRQATERLDHLLLFLKEKFGQRVEQGTRLSIRLTHQELADACCTTRVTITRLLGKLQKQRKIVFDSQHCMLFPDVRPENHLKAG